MKAGIDKATNTMKNYEEKLEKLKEKGYPEEMNTFCASMILKLQPHTQEAQMAYNEEVVKVPGADVAALKEKAMTLEKQACDLDSFVKEWLKKEGADINRLCN